ncbi:uncharacterized protein [Oscarella lobularis]|uniref:uncharacterized protein n=1 Tax=Oscarella lobularis TaxID=121494 RepID=UPI00331332DC
MRKISKLLDDLQQAGLELTNTKSSVVNKGWFPKVYDQVCGVEEQLLEADAIFRNKCTEVLPKLRELNDSSQSSQLKVSLRKAIKETEKAVKLVSRFVTAKENEVLMVRRILDEAGDQFVNDLASKQPKAAHCLVLSLAEADTIKHPLKAKLRLCKKRIIKIVNSNAEECSSSSSESDEDEDELEEWFESEMIMDNIFNNIGRMKELMMRNREGKVHENMEYRIGRIAKVDKEAVRCGDIVAVDNKGSKRRAVFLRQPTKVIAKESKNERSETQVVIEWTSDFELSLGDKCRVIYWKICDLEKRVKMSEEASVDVPVEPSSSCSVALPDSLLDCDSCYGLSVQIFSQLTGLSPRSAEVSLRPSPRMSVISRLVQFSSSHNATKLRKGGWELDKENGFLVVGRRNVRARSDQEPDKDCVVTIDVMPEYEPEIPFPRDDKEATVVLMTGLSGHGKSTHMNGMFNWIFRISQNDPIRLLLVDDRKHGDSSSKPITKRITVYRIRSHSGSRLKAPLYLIDTPAFGEGIESDENVTQAYATLFSRINKITCVVLAMRASESQCDPKTKAALTNILHQFGINVQNNIIALLTFANDDKRKPPALLAVLDEVRVPRRQYIEINNAFFACHSQEAIGSFLEASKASDTDGFGKFYWDLYEMGNEATFEAIGQLHPVNASQSASVVNERCRLEEKLLSLRSNLTALLNEFISYYRSFFSTSSYTQHSFDNFIKKHEELIATTRECFVAPLRQIALRHDPESIYDYVCSFKWASSKVEALQDAINLSVYIDDSAEPEGGASVIRCATGIKVILSVMRETKEKLSVDNKTSGLYYRVSRMLTNKYGISTCITRQIETISDKDLDQIFCDISILIKNGIFTEAVLLI